MITAKCIGIDDKGRVEMSRKAALREGAGGGDAPKASQGTPPGDDEVPPGEEEVVTFGSSQADFKKITKRPTLGRSGAFSEPELKVFSGRDERTEVVNSAR